MSAIREDAESRCAACDHQHQGERRFAGDGTGWHDFEQPDARLVATRVFRELRRQGVIN